jgi:hypothetical protein
LDSKKGSLCPNCQSVLDGVKIISYRTPFRCPECNALLEVPRRYLMVAFWLSVIITVWLCYSAGLRDFALIVGCAVAFFPIMFSIAFLQRHLFPPKLTAHPY